MISRLPIDEATKDNLVGRLEICKKINDIIDRVNRISSPRILVIRLNEQGLLSNTAIAQFRDRVVAAIDDKKTRVLVIPCSVDMRMFPDDNSMYVKDIKISDSMSDSDIQDIVCKLSKEAHKCMTK
jgi:hypothetical protein